MEKDDGMKRVKKVMSDKGVWLREYIVKAEKALGKPLPKGAEVHHVDENRLNNENSNLVVCEDKYYHKLLHLRAKALEVCGNPEARTCNFCGAWDILDNPDFRLYDRSGRNQGAYGVHRSCYNKWRNDRK